MTLSINTNIAATRASNYLASNHQNLQKSLDRLSSGKRITNPSDDAGGLAVSMKLEHSINGLKGASSNISNGISLLQVQDGILASAADIVSRMGELKSMYSDVTKNTADKATYDSEFNDLQGQLYNLALTEFNGVRTFGDFVNATTGADTAAPGTNSGVIFGAADPTSAANAGLFLSVYTTENGSSGSKVDVSKTLLLAGLSITQTAGPPSTYETNASATATEKGFRDQDGKEPAIAGVIQDGTFDLASSDSTTAANIFSLADVDQGIFTKALENVSSMRATNGGQAKRLEYAQADVENQITNLTAANGRIMDVDIATESAALAKHQILVQASASMVAQANSANNVALQLLQ